MYTVCLPGDGGDQKRVLDPLELEYRCSNSHVCSGNGLVSSGRVARALNWLSLSDTYRMPI